MILYRALTKEDLEELEKLEKILWGEINEYI